MKGYLTSFSLKTISVSDEIEPGTARHAGQRFIFVVYIIANEVL